MAIGRLGQTTTTKTPAIDLAELRRAETEREVARPPKRASGVRLVTLVSVNPRAVDSVMARAVAGRNGRGA